MVKTVLFTAIVSIITFSGSAQSLVVQSGAVLEVNGDGSGGTILDINGDLDNQGEIDLNNDAILKITGDFLRNSSSFFEGQSTVIFDGTTAQQITRTSSASTFQETFYNLTFDNPTSVTFDNGEVGLISVLNVLNPIQGSLNTNDVLRLRATSSLYARVAYGNGDVVGDVIVQKRLTNTNAGWRQLSMPITGSWEDGNWNGITFNFSDFIPSGQINTFRWSAVNSGGADYAGGWTATAGTSTSTPVAVYLEGGNTVFDVDQTFSCTGELIDNTASFAFNMPFTRDPDDLSGTNPAAKGWYLIRNPWAALIDVQTLLTSTSFKAFEPAYKAVHVYNSVAGQYQAILLNNTVTKIDWNTDGTTINDADANIPPFQAFWVKTDAANQVVTLYPDEMQTTEFKNPLNEQFMKQKPELFRLNVFDADSLWDQVVVYFDNEKSRDFDNVGDAYFLASQLESAPQFYGLEGNLAASIIGRPYEISDSVEISFQSSKLQSDFHIMPDLSELENDWHVYLKDRLTNQTIKVESRTSYTFKNLNSVQSKRFVIYFSQKQEAFEHLVTGEQAEIFAYAQNGNIVVQSLGVAGPATVNVFDMTGRQLQNEQIFIHPGDQHEIYTSVSGTLVMLSIEINGRVENFKLYL